MRTRWTTAGFVALVMFGACMRAGVAGDSLSGRIVEVPSAEVVVLDYGAGRYNVRIIGVNAPKEGALAAEARQFVARLVLGKAVRIRFEARAPNGEMISKLFTNDPVIGIKDVGLELVRAGLARRQTGQDYQFDYKYNELSSAEREAQAARRGLWAAVPPTAPPPR